MAIARLVPRNQLQSPLLSAVKEGRVTNSTTGLYTVPAGKVALVTQITGLQDALGTDGTGAIGVEFSANFIPLSVFVTATNGVNFVSWTGSMLLVAGDVITNEGDSGATNHTWDMTASVKEYSA